MHNQTVETVMTANVLSVRPSTLVAEISALLIHHKISAVPVLDTDGCAAPPSSFSAGLGLSSLAVVG